MFLHDKGLQTAVITAEALGGDEGEEGRMRRGVSEEEEEEEAT